MRILLLPLFLLPWLAHADSWTPASARDGDTWSVDTASIKAVTVNGKNYKQATVLGKFKEAVEDFGRKSDSLQAVMLFDCAAKLSGNREEHGFLGGKPSYNRVTPDDQLDLMDYYPDTTGGDLAKAVCGK